VAATWVLTRRARAKVKREKSPGPFPSERMLAHHFRPRNHTSRKCDSQ